MRGKGKHFVVYRKGPANFTIVPRGWQGWAQFSVWMALLAPLIIWFSRYAEAHPDERGFYDGLALFCIGVALWLVGGFWWMFAHAEEIDVVEMTRRRYMQQRKQRR